MELHRRIFGRRPAEDDLARWAASGAMSLTGEADADPLAAPASLVPAVLAMGEELAAATAVLGACVDLDTLALLGERAATAGLTRHGDRSCGGATRLVRALDGWLAVSLPRPDDLELLPAWLGGDDVDTLVAGRPAAALVAAAVELGLAVAALGERTVADGPAIGVDARAERPAPASSVTCSSPTCRRCGPDRSPATCSRRPAPGSSRWRARRAPMVPAAAPPRSTTCSTPARKPPPSTSTTSANGRCCGAWSPGLTSSSRPPARGRSGSSASMRRLRRPMAPCGCRSRGTDGRGAAGCGWRSVTTRRWPAGSWRGRPSGRSSVATRSPTRWRGWSARSPCSSASARAAHACSTWRWPVSPPSARDCHHPGRTWTGPVAPPRAREPAGIAPALGADTDAIVAELGLG